MGSMAIAPWVGRRCCCGFQRTHGSDKVLQPHFLLTDVSVVLFQMWDEKERMHNPAEGIENCRLATGHWNTTQFYLLTAYTFSPKKWGRKKQIQLKYEHILIEFFYHRLSAQVFYLWGCDEKRKLQTNVRRKYFSCILLSADKIYEDNSL